MADPRLSVLVDGLHEQRMSVQIDDSTITYDATEDGGSSSVGLAVTFSDDLTIETVGDGEFVLGRLEKVEADGIAAVAYHGFVKLPGGSGATLTLGKKIVGDLGAASAEGYIREVNTATTAELGVCRGFIADASVTTAVAVFL